MFLPTLLAATLGLVSAQRSSAIRSAGSASAVSNPVTSSATAPLSSASARSLATNEQLVTDIVYVSSLTKAITTVYTTTSVASAPMTQPTNLPASLYCSAGYANATGPFCFPHNGTQQIKGKQYSVTWNSGFAPNCTDVYLSLAYYHNENGQQVTSQKLENVIGYWNYTVQSSWLNGQGSQYAQVQILPYNCGEGTVDPVAGPIVELLSSAPVTEEKPTSKDEILGLSIGLPLAVIAFVGTALFVMWWNKSHRQIPKFGRRKGYTGRSQRNIRLQDMARNNGQNAYKDDPLE